MYIIYKLYRYTIYTCMHIYKLYIHIHDIVTYTFYVYNHTYIYT